jgi:hypothetical protein
VISSIFGLLHDLLAFHHDCIGGNDEIRWILWVLALAAENIAVSMYPFSWTALPVLASTASADTPPTHYEPLVHLQGLVRSCFNRIFICGGSDEIRFRKVFLKGGGYYFGVKALCAGEG